MPSGPPGIKGGQPSLHTINQSITLTGGGKRCGLFIVTTVEVAADISAPRGTISSVPADWGRSCLSGGRFLVNPVRWSCDVGGGSGCL